MAVCVGSRGIAELVPIVATIVRRLRQSGLEPFITPAMGSHGGATADGQIEVLQSLGITAESTGAPLRATMDVEILGNVDGVPVFLDRYALEADGLILVNRVKSHTDFTGPIESGLMKLLVIGLSNHEGARSYHLEAVSRGFPEVLLAAGRFLLSRRQFVAGVAVVENQRHQPSLIRLTDKAGIEETDRTLLPIARSLLPTLPVQRIDLLIVDEMGKNISGAGLDPNVTGRVVASWMSPRDSPRIGRVVVRDLTKESEGNAIGLGQVDFITKRFLSKIDFDATTINAIDASAPEDAHIPPAMATDKEAVLAALRTCGAQPPGEARVVHIKNSLALDRVVVSEPCLDELRRRTDVIIGDHRRWLRFDDRGTLVSPL